MSVVLLAAGPASKNWPPVSTSILRPVRVRCGIVMYLRSCGSGPVRCPNGPACELKELGVDLGPLDLHLLYGCGKVLAQPRHRRARNPSQSGNLTHTNSGIHQLSHGIQFHFFASNGERVVIQTRLSARTCDFVPGFRQRSCSLSATIL